MIPTNGLTALIIDLEDETEIVSVLINNYCLSYTALSDIARLKRVIRKALDKYKPDEFENADGTVHVIAYHLPVHLVERALLESDFLSEKGLKLIKQRPPKR
jgi:hypothetical protein